jgi:hypothetical protein
MAAYTKKYNGSAWVTAPVKKYNGSAWVDAKVQKYNGSSWVQLYPEASVSTTKTLTGTNLNTYRSSWDGGSVAKQGKYSSYAAAHGYLGVSATSLTGYGSVSSISSATFSGTRDGSGSYGSNQTLYFYRGNVAPTSSSPVNTLTGSWTSTTGAPGSGGAMSNRAVTVNTNTLNWANNVSSKPYMYIYSTATGDYAGIKTSFSIKLTYTYGAKMVTFTDIDSQALSVTPYTFKSMTGKNAYHSMLVYEGEENMSLSEIIKRREDGIVEPIDATSVIDLHEQKPWTREYEIKDNKVRIEVFNMKWDDEAQYSLDGEKWFTLYSESKESNYLSATLPEDFNKYRDFVHIRVIDKKKDISHLKFEIEPLIYIPDKTKGIILPGEELDLDKLLK